MRESELSAILARHDRIALQLSGGKDSLACLTVDRLRELLDYSVITGKFYWRVGRKGFSKAGDVAGSLKNNGYLVIKLDGKNYMAHRLAWLHVFGQWPSGEIDHINRIRLSNGICNLREANSSGNKSNTAWAKRNSTGYRGVLYLKRTGKFYAKVQLAGKQYQGPCRSTPEEAAVDAARLRVSLHGEFASHD